MAIIEKEILNPVFKRWYDFEALQLILHSNLLLANFYIFGVFLKIHVSLAVIKRRKKIT